ncbi:MAG: DinB family protein [Vicinamibacteria bacterium]
MSTPDDVREQLLRTLRGASAHPEVTTALEGVPAVARGRCAPGFPHTLWQLLERLRIAQRDILDFGRTPDHESPEFPKGYWPESEAPPSDAAWEKSLKAFLGDLDALQKIAADRNVDLTAPIPHLDGPTWFREMMLVVSHNAYHLGQFVQVRRALGCWEN